MIAKLPESSGNVFGFRIQGKLIEADYRDHLVPVMERGMKEYPKIRVVWVMENFEGWTVGAAWEDILLGLEFSDVEKMAMVIDESWDDWITLMFKIFTTITGTDSGFSRKSVLTKPGTGYGLKDCPHRESGAGQYP